MNERELKLYEDFNRKFAKTREFVEVETAFKVMRPLEKLPQEIDEKTSTTDIDSYLDLSKYIDDKINDTQRMSPSVRPAYMNTQAQREDQSDISEEDDVQALKLETFDSCKHFNKEKLIKEWTDMLKEADEEFKDKEEEDLLSEFGRDEYSESFPDSHLT